MAKKRGAKKGGNKAKKAQIRRIKAVVRSGLDNLGQAYANLLLDPCGAPLAYPVWGSQEGSLLVKAESIITVANDAANLNGVFAWSPGTLTTANYASMIEAKTLNTNTVFTSNVATGTGYTVTDQKVNFPGFTFLTNQVSVYRPIAACVEVMYNGTEASRSGSIGGGVVAGGTWYAANMTVDQIAALVPHGERTPVNKTEFLWYPSGADDLFTDPSESIASQQVDRRNSIVINWANLAATTGLRLKLTAIYEYKPKVATGIAMPVPEAGSRNNMREILTYALETASSNPWVRSAAANAGAQFVRAVQYHMHQRPRYRVRDREDLR